MPSSCLSIAQDRSVRTRSTASLKARATVHFSLNQTLLGSSSIGTGTDQLVNINQRLISSSKIVVTKSNISYGPKVRNLYGAGGIYAHLRTSNSASSRLPSQSQMLVGYVDKFAGNVNRIKSIKNFIATEKLYPIRDIVTSLNNSYFVNKQLSSGNLFASIDEGVFTGNYTELGNNGTLICDEKNTYIQPSSIFTHGDFRYKFEVTTPTASVRESFLFLRAAAPLSNYSSDVPPQYKIHNIKLEDPSGNLIIQYKDIILRGDANYREDYINFATYVSEPVINNLSLHTWHVDYPLMSEASGYTMNLDFTIQCLDDPFNMGFNSGYEDTCTLDLVSQSNNNYLAVGGSPFSTQSANFSLNPTNSLRISAIEICNSGGVGILRDSYLSFFSEAQASGRRLSRNIVPAQVLLSDFNSSIYPDTTSLWVSYPASGSNATRAGCQTLTDALLNEDTYDFITLSSTASIADSGKLHLKFSHSTPQSVIDLREGAFSFGSYFSGYDTASLQPVYETDNFFVIDNIELKIKAKKAIGSRNYVLDVVGYSDDKILNVTSAKGGFLQNISGQGNIPYVSGFNTTDELGISSESISDKAQYFHRPATSSPGGDHYQLVTSPVVSGTSFAEYIIPLKIYDDNVLLGKSVNYSMSSYFENLYLDLFPLPSGASFASIQLVVTYKPSNAIMLHTVGQSLETSMGLKSVKIYPSTRRLNDDIINSGPDFAPLSRIQNIPQAFTTPATIKSNYSRRWRGIDGQIVNGPYGINEFDFSFSNPQLLTPFLRGSFSFNKDSGNYIISDYIGENITPYSGVLSGTYNKTSNLGLRFNSTSLFSAQTPYKTIDWTSISGYANNALYGHIADSFDNVVRISGASCNINFGNIDTASGFSIYTRFSPDITISGANYNLFNSGIIFSKWDSGKQLEFALGFDSGNLRGYARNTSGNIITIVDSIPYSGYQYPLSILLTYNDNNSQKLRLYTDNELSGTFDVLRSSSSSFSMYTSDSNFVVGNCGGSGVGMNMFLSDVGISTYNASGTNIVYENPDRFYKQATAQSVFDGIRIKFWADNESYNNDRFMLPNYVDEDTSTWHIGDFKICEFSPSFDFFTRRVGSDFITHSINHNGSGYSQFTNTTLPSSVITSGLAYHTQLENDFLRFNLMDIPEVNPAFYSIRPRISKNLPRGYNFAERAFVVETIIESESYNNIQWADGSLGPKLIVSLYTKSQEPVDRPSKVNWGLINRDIHYLEPSGCIRKLSSVFNFNNLIDTSEPWSSFDIGFQTSELSHKYFSSDINDMFLQYDLAFPSGSPFNSIITIHSSHVRLEDALVEYAEFDKSVNLVTSGDQSAVSSVNLHTLPHEISYDQTILHVSGNYAPVASAVLNIYCSGAVLATNNLNLRAFTVGEFSSSGTGDQGILGLPLYCIARTSSSDEQSLQLIVKNLVEDQTTRNDVALFTSNIIYKDDQNVNLYSRGVNAFINFRPREVMPLWVQRPDYILNSLSSSMNLYVPGDDFTRTQLSNSVNLFTINYPAYNQLLDYQGSITWDSDNVGSNIVVDDNNYSSLSANDEIRGVDLMCYGNCYSPDSCVEPKIIVHERDWSSNNSCVDGGVLRASNTYTNLATSGFNTNVGYSGHFYGIRKYQDLIPHAPYNIIITAQAGSDASINVPSELREIEYGTNNYVGYSGLKMVADSPYSASGRVAGDQYGFSVAAKNNVMIIGSPFHSILDENNTQLSEAGSVFIYNRNNRPSGYSWPAGQDKSDWILDTKLTLPSGFVRDYYTERDKVLVFGMAPIKERLWKVGQEGRQFGHSIDLAISDSGIPSVGENNRQIIAVGAPSSKWSRTFDGVAPSSVQIGVMVFTEEFTQYPGVNPITLERLSYVDVMNTINNQNIVFKYMSSPPISLDVKLMILEPIADANIIAEEFSIPKPSFITKKPIHRNQGPVNSNQTAKILSGIKETFHETFPFDNNKLHNNIPPIVNFYVDNSRSLGRSALTPAIDEFISYYKSYSFASGLTDFFGVRASGSISEFVPTLVQSENWVNMSSNIIDYTLDTGRLVSTSEIRLLTSGVGVEFFNPELGEFNYPPTSGGAVFIFEKENSEWNLIQQIDSPTLQYYGQPDRIGNSISISDDTEVIAVGSPYINDACNVYEYKPSEKTRMYSGVGSWLSFKSSVDGGIGRYANLLNTYTLLDTNAINDGKTLYSELTSSEKFSLRRYHQINEYKNIYTYKYSDISMIGTWKFIPDRFAPTSRLGYSTAVNSDGTLVAFGAPTDSFNEYEDSNVYYQNNGYYDPQNIDNLNTYTILPSWRSSVNAGCVRLFDSRKYYPHNKAVEFTKFGNLQQSLSNIADSGQYNYLSQIFNYDRSFHKTEFTDLEIPQDAGLAFIITPEIDALSDEILDNIIKWLSLGDRNLVLVGNDPIWEDDGAYLNSNKIINKILTGLNSRMRLYPARNIKEALSSGCIDGYNIVASFQPTNGTPSFITPRNMRGYGVADIRMEFPTYPDQTVNCSSILNYKCELPLKHGGDLRAEWIEGCYGCSEPITYNVNWPLVFGTYVAECCNPLDVKVPVFNLSGRDPVPLLAAAEFSEASTIVYPAIPATSSIFPVFKDVYYYSTPKLIFDQDNISTNTSILWSADSGNYTSLNTNITNTINTGRFFTPEPFDDHYSILQASSTNKEEQAYDLVQVSSENYCAEEQYGDTSSKVVLIAGIETESSKVLYNPDNNLNFYINLVSKSINGEAVIAQLGGWTNRTSLNDSNPKSILEQVFKNNGNTVELNVGNLYDRHDVCWISNVDTLPSDQDITSIKGWLNTGNKKLIITYRDSVSQARTISLLCDMLNIAMRPLYLPVLDKYAQSVSPILTFNSASDISIGYGLGTSILALYAASNVSYIPINIGLKAISICAGPDAVRDLLVSTVGYSQIKSGITKVVFPALAGSGYRIRIDTISETPIETGHLRVVVAGALGSAKLNAYPFSNYVVQDLNDVVDGLRDNFSIPNVGAVINPETSYGITNNTTIDLRVASGISEIIFYVFSNEPRLNSPTKTARLVAISGSLIPIIETVAMDSFREFDYYDFLIEPAKPEVVITIPPVLRQIKTDNSKYCSDVECVDGPHANQLIADGPVVVAQEIEGLSTFDAGIARSRITLISDSSLLQGSCLVDIHNNNSIPSDTVEFIRSLYPKTSFASVNAGRQFNTMTKIMSPERGSPQKSFAMFNNSGINMLFKTSNPQQGSLSDFSSLESRYSPDYVVRPQDPWTGYSSDAEIKAKIRTECNIFNNNQHLYGATAKFSGIIEGVMREDAGRMGGIPQIMTDTGYDYLDFSRFPSGYRGDLFGYSINLYGKKLLVGSPMVSFSSETVYPWSYYVAGGVMSGVKISHNGGAGAVYLFEKTFQGSGLRGSLTPWEFKQKIRPSSINVGQDLTNANISQSSIYLGSNTYSSQDLTNYTIIGDRFGQSVSMDADAMIIGAPGHDFGNYVLPTYTGAFIRKDFNTEFDIPERVVIDLGNSGVRSVINSGTCVLNNGAVFVLENRITDWPNKKHTWTVVEKIVPVGYNTTLQSQINSDFGTSAYIDKSNRTDADYTIVVGSHSHQYATSGNHISNQPMVNAGASYTYDAMVRGQPPSRANKDSFINARVFGETDALADPSVKISIKNDTYNTLYYATGLVYSNNNGEIFIEASGRDPATKGFIQHRPYIQSIHGQYAHGQPLTNAFRLSTFGMISANSNMSAYTQVENSAFVYNNVELYVGSVIDIASGVPSGLSMYLDCPVAINVLESGLSLRASGIGASTESLNLRVKGRS